MIYNVYVTKMLKSIFVSITIIVYKICEGQTESLEHFDDDCSIPIGGKKCVDITQDCFDGNQCRYDKHCGEKGRCIRKISPDCNWRDNSACSSYGRPIGYVTNWSINTVLASVIYITYVKTLASAGS